MEEKFDGIQIRDEILKSLANRIVGMENKPSVGVFLIGDNPVCKRYVELKKKMAEKTGIQFCLYKFEESEPEENILNAIEYLNKDAETEGIMIQIPVPKKFDTKKLIEKISPAKDIDGLRFCAGLNSNFLPPVVLSILEAIKRSSIKIQKKTKIVQVGLGFLVGAPLQKVLEKEFPEAELIVARKQDDLAKLIEDADIVISATGKSGIVKPEMVKEGVVLIDAGTAEENGELKGDIDPEAYEKASFYTPVPGGIGPVTVAMLFRNLLEVSKNELKKS